MLPSLRYAPPQAQRSNSQREGATINGSKNLKSVFDYAIQHTQGEKKKLINDINTALSELEANELPEYAQFQVKILKNKKSGPLLAILRKPSETSINFLKVQLKPENASTYEGNLLEYLRDALYGVLAEYRKHCPKPIEDTQVRAVSA
jgi:hypothetical protein